MDVNFDTETLEVLLEPRGEVDRQFLLRLIQALKQPTSIITIEMDGKEPMGYRPGVDT